MKLKYLTLENFRGVVRKTRIDFQSGITALIGKNDVGKSTIIEALDAFFNGIIDNDDASVCGDKTKVRITCAFTDLPDFVVLDATRSTTLKSEYLLNEEGFLEIEKVFDCSGSKPKEKVYCLANHPIGDAYSDLLTLKIEKLKARADKLNIDLKKVNRTVSSEVRQAIWDSSRQICKVQEIPLEREDGKRIYEAIQAYLPVYSLFKADRPSTDQDAEAQDPMRTAIREATAGLSIRFEAIREEIVRRLSEIAKETVRKIGEMVPAVAEKLKPRVETKKLESLFSVSLVGDGDVPINKRGSGIRRLVLLGFFRAEAERRLEAADNKSKSVIYAIEEPETSQHPHSQIQILAALKELACRECVQVIITTHNPLLASRLEDESLRYLARDEEGLNVCCVDDKSKPSIARSLGVLPDHNILAILEVEGPNDITFFKSVSRNLSTLHPEAYADFGNEEMAGRLVILPMGGSTLAVWANQLAGLNRPVFHVIDRDAQPSSPPKYAKEIKAFRDAGHTVFVTSCREIENYIPLSVLKHAQPFYAGTGDLYDGVPELFSKASKDAYTKACRLNDAHKPRMYNHSSAKEFLNRVIASQINSDSLFEEGDKNGELRKFIENVSQVLLKRGSEV